MIFSAKAIPITRKGLNDALEILKMDPGDAAVLWAIFEVETAGLTKGFGFRPDKRPQILFERHKFREFTNGMFNKSSPDISGPQGGYGRVSQQYQKLEKAIYICEENQIDIEAPLKSVSWGIGQVMGFNHRSAGFSTAKDMVEAMVKDEDSQLMAMVNFISNNGLDGALRTRNWARFARMYNGRDYAKNRYDVNLESQYLRFSSGSTPDIEVRTAQAALTILGFPLGKIDGIIGERTKRSIRSFQISSNILVTSKLTSETYSMAINKAFS